MVSLSNYYTCHKCRILGVRFLGYRFMDDYKNVSVLKNMQEIVGFRHEQKIEIIMVNARVIVHLTTTNSADLLFLYYFNFRNILFLTVVIIWMALFLQNSNPVDKFNHF